MPFDEDSVKRLVRDLQAAGCTKYRATIELEVKFELTHNQAYYRVRKYWLPPSL